MSDNEENINSNLDVTTSIVDDIVNGELADAQNTIKGILSQNMADEIEGHKQEFAATLFQDEPEVEVEDTEETSAEVETEVAETEE
tara:strand:+ start:2634 stop:2891 length:258 start_codon:yes stop_codon:yes gene_type:complete